jgi:hypothetical protein
MNFKKKISGRIFASTCLVVSLAFVSSCVFSTKAIYFEKELAVAERAAARFHELHNQQNFSGIYDLLDKQAQPSASESVLSEISANYDKVGRSMESRLVEKKVFQSPAPGYTSQVKLAYETKFEKGDWTELFAWNIRDSSQAVLVEYILEPRTGPSPDIR